MSLLYWWRQIEFLPCCNLQWSSKYSKKLDYFICSAKSKYGWMQAFKLRVGRQQFDRKFTSGKFWKKEMLEGGGGNFWVLYCRFCVCKISVWCDDIKRSLGLEGGGWGKNEKRSLTLWNKPCSLIIERVKHIMIGWYNSSNKLELQYK